MQRFNAVWWTMIAALPLAAAGCAGISTVTPMTVPLAYKETPENGATLISLTCPYLAHVQVIDKRTDPVLGIRYLESKPLKADVTAGNDPATWAQAGIEAYLRQNHAKIGEVGPTLLLELQSLKTSEDIDHRAGYDARITFAASLQSPMGKACWHASLDGKGGNYGYAGSIANYQETLNEALDKVASQVLTSSDFNTALCHCAD
jgi:hypothetical protein